MVKLMKQRSTLLGLDDNRDASLSMQIHGPDDDVGLDRRACFACFWNDVLAGLHPEHQFAR
jgi:hypothetical protein